MYIPEEHQNEKSQSFRLISFVIQINSNIVVSLGDEGAIIEQGFLFFAYIQIRALSCGCVRGNSKKS